MKTALVVIDVQNGFISGHTAHVVPVVAALAATCSQARVDVVFTRFVNQPGSAFERLLGWRELQAPPSTDIVPELAHRVQHVRDKYHYSAFTSEFEELVDARGWTRLLLCGIATEACVLKTAVDAFERGLTPVVVEDACASDGGRTAHEAGLLVIRRVIGAAQLVDAMTTQTRLLSREWS